MDVISQRYRHRQKQHQQARHARRSAYEMRMDEEHDLFDDDDDYTSRHPLRRQSFRQSLRPNSPLDTSLVICTLVLVIFGLVAVYSASAYQAQNETGNSAAFLIKQALAAILGLGMMVAVSRVPFSFWHKIAKPLALASIGLLVITLVIGTAVNGSERWIPLGFGFNLQPSEIAKLAAIALMAQATSHKRFFNWTLFVNLILVGVMTGLILKQPNLSVSMILSFTTFGMMFIGGLPIYLMVPIVPTLLYGVVKKIQDTPYQMRRIKGWLNPWADPQDTGYNLIQSYYAIGSGGIFGAGLGHSIQKLYYLPFQYTDFIFAVICEELGLVGALTLIGLFAFLVWRGFSIALNCPNRFGQMLAFGITICLAIQTMINISVTIGLMPVTGVTLPLISYGGTSMLTTLAMIGILLNVSRYQYAGDSSQDDA